MDNTSSQAKLAKSERFSRIASTRTNAILKAIDSLVRCADKRSYEYSEGQVESIFSLISKKLIEAYATFHTKTGREKRFSLFEPAWYFISADGGNTWTKQILTSAEASQHLNDGFMLLRTDPLAKPPEIKVWAVYDYESFEFRVYSSCTNLNVETIDTGTADPSDADYESHKEEIYAKIETLNDRVLAKELEVYG